MEVKDPQREPIRLLVEFLRVWYDREGLEARLRRLPADAYQERQLFHTALTAFRPGVPCPIEEILNQDLAVARAADNPDDVVSILVELSVTSDGSSRCLDIAFELTELDRRVEALTACDRAITLTPDDWLAYGVKANILLELARYWDSLECSNLAIELNPDIPITWFNRGYALGQLDRKLEALAAYKRACELKPTDALTWSNMGFTLTTLDRNEEALAAFDQAIDLLPEYSINWSNRGQILKALGRRDEAIVAYNQALELAPDYKTWDAKGDALVQLGRHEDAIDAFNAAIQLNEDDPLVWTRKGYALTTLGRHEEALRVYQHAITLKDDLQVAWNNLGGTFNDLGRHVEAIAACDRAIELRPEDFGSRAQRGLARVGMGQIDRAIDDYRYAIKLNPSFSDAFDGLAEALILRGRWDEAEDVMFQRFSLPISPSNPEQSRHLPHLISTLFRTIDDTTARTAKVRALAQIAQKARQTWDSATGNAVRNPPHPLAMLSDSLVRSLKAKAYLGASHDSLDAWATAWEESAKHHPKLSFGSRLFTVGVKYLKTNDERGLLDLVQEERSILRELFGLPDVTQE